MRATRQSWHRALTMIVSVTSLAACQESDAPDDEVQPVRGFETARVVSAADALLGAHLPTLDPATMEKAEIRLVLGERSICVFRYVSEGKAVVGVHRAAESKDATARGVLKLNGSLVPLSGERRGSGLVLAAGEVRATVTPVNPEDDLDRASPRIEANLLFEIGQQLNVGYQGYYSCPPSPAPST